MPYDVYPAFDFDETKDDECVAEFRVRKREILMVTETLQIPLKLLYAVSCNVQGTAGEIKALHFQMFDIPYLSYSDMWCLDFHVQFQC